MPTARERELLLEEKRQERETKLARERDPSLYLTLEDAASQLHLSYSTVLRRVKNGQLRARSIGNRTAIHEDALDSYRRAREGASWLGLDWDESE